MKFAECSIPRSKTDAAPQELMIPEPLRAPLRGWWERAGRPASGPVFPVRRGPRAGEEKSQSNSYAKRLRRDLFRAGVYREPPIEVPAKKPGQRTDLGKVSDETKLAPNPRDPLYFEKSATLPVDFHSFRRAFSTALAEAGVNVQHAMNLTSHSDPRVHERYVMNTKALRSVPEAALPRLLTASLPGLPAANNDTDDDPDPRPGGGGSNVTGNVTTPAAESTDPALGTPPVTETAKRNVTARDVSFLRRGASLLARRAKARHASKILARSEALKSQTGWFTGES